MPQVIKELKPIKESTEDYDKIEARIKALFLKVLYRPLMKALGADSSKIRNAKSWLMDAIKSGRVTYSNGQFKGKFNASISKEIKSIGGKWDKKSSSFKILSKDLPMDIRSSISISESAFISKMTQISKKLSDISPEEIAKQLKTADLFDSTLFKVERDFQKSVSNITIPPSLNETQRAKIAREWQDNIDLYIKDFSNKQIKDLRSTIQQSIFSGNRYESLIKGIESSYNVTKNKAKFLARQETSILMSKFKETRYVEAGVNEYKWGCVKMPHDKSPDHHVLGNVRYTHGKLEGHIFRWDDPPITSNPDEPVRRNNPGTDFNCRCYAIPLVRFNKQ